MLTPIQQAVAINGRRLNNQFVAAPSSNTPNVMEPISKVELHSQVSSYVTACCRNLPALKEDAHLVVNRMIVYVKRNLEMTVCL
mmetsp:Transcript_25270/g.38226  ORF Transcript_25270/g.38226 Transcript_25270/m.38226 type:complete len:84 (+) Transcript_25270:819-1070(+)